MRVGITGHQKLADATDWQWVADRIDDFLATAGVVTGLTSLAAGADQLFAERVVAQGGRLYVIIPHERYEESFTAREDRVRYEALLRQARDVEILKTSSSHEQAYLLAGYRVADLADIVLAVWDGKPAAGKGGTADMVKYALAKGVSVVHINPLTGLVAPYSENM